MKQVIIWFLALGGETIGRGYNDGAPGNELWLLF